MCDYAKHFTAEDAKGFAEDAETEIPLRTFASTSASSAVRKYSRQAVVG